VLVIGKDKNMCEGREGLVNRFLESDLVGG
jgi:hypothetical protein